MEGVMWEEQVITQAGRQTDRQEVKKRKWRQDKSESNNHTEHEITLKQGVKRSCCDHSLIYDNQFLQKCEMILQFPSVEEFALKD